MATARPRTRPLSPHMTIWKWRVHMATSIMHRATGNAMAFGAVLIFLWWLIAAATGPEAYATFYEIATGPFGIIVGVGFTWVLFQHMMSGLRHLYLDTGAGYEISGNRRLAAATFVASTLLTLIVWAIILLPTLKA